MTGGELAPRDTTQTLMATCFVLSGVIVLALVFGNMAAIMHSFNKK